MAILAAAVVLPDPVTAAEPHGVASALRGDDLAERALAPLIAQRQRRGPGRPSKPYAAFERMGLFRVGLRPVYPDEAKCLQIASYFGDKTRYDGSTRRNNHYGFHGGMDISADEGTPLIAIANGTVVHAGTGGLLVGNFVWLRHLPADSGLPVFVYAKYQHLMRPTALRIGGSVKLGGVVGAVGRTGTTGGHFGARGYSHLHLSILVAEGPEFEIRQSSVLPQDLRFLDPLALFIRDGAVAFDNHALRDLPAAAKRIAIAYMTPAGRIVPDGATIVWPLACAAK